jgi:hypothetical protein
MSMNLRLAASSLSDTVYIGKVSDCGTHFVGDKKDVTSDFFKAIIDLYAGYSTEIVGEGGKRYKLTVQEISK